MLGKQTFWYVGQSFFSVVPVVNFLCSTLNQNSIGTRPVYYWGKFKTNLLGWKTFKQFRLFGLRKNLRMTNITSSAGKDLFLSPEPSNSRRMSRHSAGSSGCSVPRSSVSSCSFDSPSSTRACRVTASIPPSPFMQKLGCGTGVSVYLFQRYCEVFFFLGGGGGVKCGINLQGRKRISPKKIGLGLPLALPLPVP